MADQLMDRALPNARRAHGLPPVVIRDFGQGHWPAAALQFLQGQPVTLPRSRRFNQFVGIRPRVQLPAGIGRQTIKPEPAIGAEDVGARWRGSPFPCVAVEGMCARRFG